MNSHSQACPIYNGRQCDCNYVEPDVQAAPLPKPAILTHLGTEAYTLAQLRAYGDARALAALSQGWVMVPRKPTKEMLMAGLDAKAFGREDIWSWDDPQAVYFAMLAAAPKAADGSGGETA